jgi:hypothetical protein
MNKPKSKIQKDISTLVSCIFPKDREKFLLSCGMDRLVIANRRLTFDLLNCVSSFKPKISEVKTRNVGEQKQIECYQKLMANPLKGSGTFVVNSFPTDLRAKQLAAVVMNRAMDIYSDFDNRHRAGRSAPMWIKLTGYSSHDVIKQIRETNPCMLIITNINDESTPYKIEKLRDILDVFDSIPKLVVTAGQDPLTFFARKLYYPVTAAIRIGSDQKITHILDML